MKDDPQLRVSSGTSQLIVLITQETSQEETLQANAKLAAG